MKQNDFKNNLRIQLRYKTGRVDATLYPTFLITFDCLVHKLRSRMSSIDTHYSVMDQANIRLGLRFPKSNFLPRQVLHIRLHPLLLA
jgi:hypothetical protein